MGRLAGTGLSLADLRATLFGSSPSAKAFRAVVKKSRSGDLEKNDPLLTLAVPAIAALAGSQAFKVESNATGDPLVWRDVVADPYTFIVVNDWFLANLKKWLDLRLGVVPTRLSAETGKFLRAWVNTDGHHLPRPTPETVDELSPFRPEAPVLLHRGIRFNDIGEMVGFHRRYAAGKPFPFESKRCTSWSKSLQIAERFARYRPAESHNAAMMGFFSRLRSGKDYEGTGGYVISARVTPSDCLVDLTSPNLPFSGGIHGHEGEVIVRPNTSLVAKVSLMVGDAEAEVASFMTGKGGDPTDPNFFNDGWLFTVDAVEGDSESGVIHLSVDDPKDGSPRKALESHSLLSDPIDQLRRHLYDTRWIDDSTIRYERLSLPSRVASRWRSVR